MTIQLMKIVCDQGLSQTLASCGDDSIPEFLNDRENQPLQIYQTGVSRCSWYVDIVSYLTSGKYPQNFTSAQKRALRYKASKYMIREGVLSKRNYHNLYLRCLEEEEAKQILKEFHLKEGGTGHAPGNALAHQIIRVGYYWPYLFRDTHSTLR